MNRLMIVFCFIILSIGEISCKREKIKYFQDNDKIVAEKYVDGKIQESVTYLLDSFTKQDRSVYYTHSGVVDRIEHWNKGNLVGEYVKYDGGIPKLFICYDSYGDTIFLRKFLGRKIVSEAGKLLPHGTLDTDYLTSDSVVRYASFLVTPPHVGIKTKSYVINMNKNDTITPFKIIDEYNWIHYYTFKLKEKGDYKYYQTVLISDTLNKMTVLKVTDTVMFSW